MKINTKEAPLVSAVEKLGGLPRVFFHNEYTIGCGVLFVMMWIEPELHRLYGKFCTGVWFSFLISGGAFAFWSVDPPDPEIPTHEKISKAGIWTIIFIMILMSTTYPFLQSYFKELGFIVYVQ